MTETGTKKRVEIEDIREYFKGKPLIYLVLLGSLIFTFFVISFNINLYFYTSTFIVGKLEEPSIYIGISVSVFTLGVIIFATVGGIAFGRTSIRLLVLIALTATTVGSVATGYVQNIPELLLARFVVGIGTGMLQGTVLGLLGAAYPEKRGLLLSLAGISFSGGLLFGPYSEALIAPLYLQSYLIGGGMGVISIILVVLLMPRVYSTRGKGGHTSWKGLFNRNTSLLFSGIFFYGIGFFGFIGYFSHFLLDYLHTGQYISALTASMLGIGGVVFTLPFGYASDRVGRKYILLLLYGLLSLASFIIFGLASAPTELIIASFLFGSAYNGLIVVIAAAAQDYTDRRFVGTASGLVFTFYYAGGIIGGTFFGVMLSFVNFRLTGLLSVACFMVIGLLATAFMTKKKVSTAMDFPDEEA